MLPVADYTSRHIAGGGQQSNDLRSVFQGEGPNYYSPGRRPDRAPHHVEFYRHFQSEQSNLLERANSLDN